MQTDGIVSHHDRRHRTMADPTRPGNQARPRANPPREGHDLPEPAQRIRYRPRSRRRTHSRRWSEVPKRPDMLRDRRCEKGRMMTGRTENGKSRGSDVPWLPSRVRPVHPGPPGRDGVTARRRRHIGRSRIASNNAGWPSPSVESSPAPRPCPHRPR